MRISRRGFLKGSLATLFLAGTGLPVYSSTKAKKNLVVIMLRGGMDALCAVPVVGDKNFEKRRKQLILDDTIKLNSENNCRNLSMFFMTTVIYGCLFIYYKCWILYSKHSKTLLC